MLVLAAGNGPDDDKRLLSGCDRVGQWGVRRLMGQIFLAGEESQEGTALLRDVVADGSAQHGIAGLERVEDRALGGRTLEFGGRPISGCDLRTRSSRSPPQFIACQSSTYIHRTKTGLTVVFLCNNTAAKANAPC